jgi:hypothetical protein
MTSLLFENGRLLELYMWIRWWFMSASDFETVGCAIAEAPHLYIIETYWNTTMQQNNICSIAFEPSTKEILKVVC